MGQWNPATHATQSDTFLFPTALEYAPLGHLIGSTVPVGQYRPAGQGPDPFVLPSGLTLQPPTTPQ